MSDNYVGQLFCGLKWLTVDFDPRCCCRLDGRRGRVIDKVALVNGHTAVIAAVNLSFAVVSNQACFNFDPRSTTNVHAATAISPKRATQHRGIEDVVMGIDAVELEALNREVFNHDASNIVERHADGLATVRQIVVLGQAIFLSTKIDTSIKQGPFHRLKFVQLLHLVAYHSSKWFSLMIQLLIRQQVGLKGEHRFRGMFPCPVIDEAGAINHGIVALNPEWSDPVAAVF